MTAVHYSGGIKLLTALSPHLKKVNAVANILELETFIQQKHRISHITCSSYYLINQRPLILRRFTGVYGYEQYERTGKKKVDERQRKKHWDVDNAGGEVLYFKLLKLRFLILLKAFLVSCCWMVSWKGLFVLDAAPIS